MALTEKKKKFAHAHLDGMDNKQAAIFAGCPEKTASQAGSRMLKDPDVVAYIERLKANGHVKHDVNAEENIERPIVTRIDVANAGAKPDPLEFLISIFSDPVEDMKLRMDAAKAALPYIHGKVAEKGKKETKVDEAKKATQGGKFGTLDAQMNHRPS